MITKQATVKFAIAQHEHIGCPVPGCTNTAIVLKTNGTAEVYQKHLGQKHMLRLTPADLRAIADRVEAIQVH